MGRNMIGVDSGVTPGWEMCPDAISVGDEAQCPWNVDIINRVDLWLDMIMVDSRMLPNELDMILG